VIIVYDVYVDIFFIDNLLTNLFVLMATNLIVNTKLCCNVKFVRIALSAMAGAGISVVILLLAIPYGVIYVTIVIIQNMAMLYLMGVPHRKLFAGIIYMNAVAFAYSKLNYCIARLGGRSLSNIITITLLLIFIIVIILQKKSQSKNTIYSVTLKDKGKTIELKALYDSGNLLVEPISGSPVSVTEKTESLSKWLISTPERYKIIPYKSVGNSNGILEGMVIDQLLIQKDDEQVVLDKAVIALYDGKLSQNGSFQMILNHSLI
jgi:sigma-E processing peptidase SpoIIGA